jgi:indole-3-glycerol phosphate synthase
MNILEKIVSAKRKEILRSKNAVPVSRLEKSNHFPVQTRSLEKALQNNKGFGIIAEFKRQSPSRGIINSTASPGEVCGAYLNSGASAVSVLTDREFFGGGNDDLQQARRVCNGVILRKEFIIDEYQVIESKSIGADVILLIAGILSSQELKALSDLALSLKLEVLFEIHNESDIDKLPGKAMLIGVNSRNLDTFSINTDIPGELISKLPGTSIKIAESGIHSAEKLLELKKAGFGGFLIGEKFMKEQDPGKSCRKFIEDLGQLEQRLQGE